MDCVRIVFIRVAFEHPTHGDLHNMYLYLGCGLFYPHQRKPLQMIQLTINLVNREVESLAANRFVGR